MTTSRRVAVGLLLATTVLVPLLAAPRVRQVAGERPCDRSCLRGLLTHYLDAMVAHAPDRLPLAARVRFTEDTDEKRAAGRFTSSRRSWK